MMSSAHGRGREARNGTAPASCTASPRPAGDPPGPVSPGRPLPHGRAGRPRASSRWPAPRRQLATTTAPTANAVADGGQRRDSSIASPSQPRSAPVASPAGPGATCPGTGSAIARARAAGTARQHVPEQDDRVQAADLGQASSGATARTEYRPGPANRGHRGRRRRTARSPAAARRPARRSGTAWPGPPRPRPSGGGRRAGTGPPAPRPAPAGRPRLPAAHGHHLGQAVEPSGGHRPPPGPRSRRAGRAPGPDEDGVGEEPGSRVEVTAGGQGDPERVLGLAPVRRGPRAAHASG